MNARYCHVLVGFLALAAFAIPRPGIAREGDGEEVEMKDNSFLVEEAYNQEKGICQHIFNWMPSWDVDHGIRRRSSDFLFSQEWALFSQKHQVSYSIPILRFTDQVPGGPIFESEGVGDIMLNYRYQLLGGSGQELSCSPRFSLILPSGDENQGLGTGQVGYQINLPVSKETDHWCFHFNAGATHVPGVTAGVDPQWELPGQPLTGYNLGGSIIYKVKPVCHVLLETVAYWDEELTSEGQKNQALQVQVSPGVRWAPFTKNDTQWVLGVAAPIGVTRDAPDFSLFFYLSLEHPFIIAPRAERNGATNGEG